MQKLVWAWRALALFLLGWGVTGIVHAQSSVSLYGLIDAFVGETHAPAGSAWQVGSGGMTTSFWGVSGSEDLGQA